MNKKQKKALEIEAKYNLELERNYIPLNIWSIDVLGLDAALMLATLYEEHIYQRSKGNNGCFKCSIAAIKARIGLSEARQRKAIKVLKKKHLIEHYLRRFVDNNGHIYKRCRIFKFDFSKGGYLVLLNQMDEAKEKSRLEMLEKCLSGEKFEF